jgi:hypothetical protein
MEEPQQALKDRVASEMRDYERGRELYASRKFKEYEKATQNERKILNMVGKSEKPSPIPRQGEWVVKAPLKIQGKEKWKLSKSLGELSQSKAAETSGARPFPGPSIGNGNGNGNGTLSFGGLDGDLLGDDFRQGQGSVSQMPSLSSLQKGGNVLDRRSASAVPSIVPLSMPGQKGLTSNLMQPEADKVFATTSLRDIVKSTRRDTSVTAGVYSGAPVSSQAFHRLSTDMPKIETLVPDIDVNTEASCIFDGTEVIIDQPEDPVVPDPHAAKSPVRRAVSTVQASGTSVPHFFPLSNFDDSTMEVKDVAAIIRAAQEEADETEPGSKLNLRVKSKWFNDGAWSWEPCFVREYDESKEEFLIEWHPGVGDRGGKGRMKKVTRLNILLDGDTPEQMERRRQVAQDNRVDDEARLRYRMRLHDMPAVLQASDRQMGIVMNLLGKYVRKPERSVELLTQEVQDDYATVINKMEEDTKLQFSAEDAAGLPTFLVPVKVVPEQGTTQIPWHDYAGTFETIKFSLPQANSLLLESTQTLANEMEDIKAIRILRTIDDPQELMEFDTMQQELRKELTDDWNGNLYKRIEDAVLNAYSSEDMDGLEDEEQEQIKVKYTRFLGMVNNWYRDSLRTCALNSAEMYALAFEHRLPVYNGDEQVERLRAALGATHELVAAKEAEAANPPSEDALSALKGAVTAAEQALAAVVQAGEDVAAAAVAGAEEAEEAEADPEAEAAAAEKLAADTLAAGQAVAEAKEALAKAAAVVAAGAACRAAVARVAVLKADIAACEARQEPLHGETLPRVCFKTSLALLVEGPSPAELLVLKKALIAAEEVLAPYLVVVAKAKGSDEEDEEEDEDDSTAALKVEAEAGVAKATEDLEVASASLKAGIQFVPSLESYEEVICAGPQHIVEAIRTTKCVSLPVFHAIEQALGPIFADDAAVVAATEGVKGAMAALTAELAVLHEKFEPFVCLVAMDPDIHIDAFISTKPTTEDFRVECQRLTDLAFGVELIFMDEERFTLFHVKCDAVKQILASRARLTRTKLLAHVAKVLDDTNTDLQQRTAVIKAKVEVASDKCEDTFEVQAYSATIQLELNKMSEEIVITRGQMDLLEDFEFKVEDIVLDKCWVTVGKPAEVTALLAAAEERIANEKEKFNKELQDDKQKLTDDLELCVHARRVFCCHHIVSCGFKRWLAAGTVRGSRCSRPRARRPTRPWAPPILRRWWTASPSSWTSWRRPKSGLRISTCARHSSASTRRTTRATWRWWRRT